MLANPLSVLPAASSDGASAPLDHREMPLVAALAEYRERGTVPFSTPGHRSGAAAHPGLRALLGDDLFAADVWLNTGHFERTLRAAEALAADSWLADRAFFLSNGSTSANHAALLALIRPGDQVIVSREVHKSIIAGLILAGACPVYVTPRFHLRLGISLGPDPVAIANALVTHPTARLVILVSPNYWGVAADVGAIVEIAHARDVPVFVDEAWGPHLPFHPDLPRSALALGADCVVTSVHKLLSSLSQASLLLTRGNRIDAGRVETAVRMVRTTSPSMPILASIDACRQQMATSGQSMLDALLSLAAEITSRLNVLPGIDVINAERLGIPACRADTTRLVIDVSGLGKTGVEVEQMLWGRFGLGVEMSDLSHVICVLTIGDTADSAARLLEAFARLSREAGTVTDAGITSSAIEVPFDGALHAMSPREAYFSETRTAPLACAAGEICAELVHPYPPGIPVLLPGEVISPAKVAFLQRCLRIGVQITGPADPTLKTIRVVDHPM
jgi:arginine/lysine/ornithine decarboxylase